MNHALIRGGVLTTFLALGCCSTAAAQSAVAKEKVRDADVTVIPKGQERSSALLRPPGPDRYDSNSRDWSEVPPWRQTSFFGIRAEGQVFIYVVDCSGSMGDDLRLVRAKQEVRRSVLALQPPQRFKIIFYNDRPIPIAGDLTQAADFRSKDQMLSWLRAIDADGGTDPRVALGLALALRPDAIFLLTDGEYPDGTAATIAKKNGHKVPIHCIDLGDGSTDEQLRRIAKESGGQYRWQPAASAP